MANQASKKREKENAGIIRYLQIYLVVINIWFFVYNLLFLKGKYCTFGMLFLYAIHAAIQGICYYWVIENCKSMVFSEAIEGAGGDVLILSCFVSLFVAYSRKWMWTYIIVRTIVHPYTDSAIFHLSGNSHVARLGVHS